MIFDSIKKKINGRIETNIEENKMIEENVGNFELYKQNETENDILKWILSEIEKEEKIMNCATCKYKIKGKYRKENGNDN